MALDKLTSFSDAIVGIELLSIACAFERFMEANRNDSQKKQISKEESYAILDSFTNSIELNSKDLPEVDQTALISSACIRSFNQSVLDLQLKALTIFWASYKSIIVSYKTNKITVTHLLRTLRKFCTKEAQTYLTNSVITRVEKILEGAEADDKERTKIDKMSE